MIQDAASAIRLRRTQSLTSIIRRELERMIEHGELTAGERLNENALAAKLGVSRGPIREACRGLEQSGLVEVVANRGVIIRELDSRDAAELYEMRAVLYGLAARLLAPRITEVELAHLADHVDQMDAAMATGDLNSFYPINMRFHEAIIRFGGNHRLVSECDAIHREMHLYRRRALDVPGRMATSNTEHRVILDRLRAGDAAGAAAAHEDHVLVSRNALFGPLGHYPEA